MVTGDAFDGDQALEVFQSAPVPQDADGMVSDRSGLGVRRDDDTAIDLAELLNQLRDVRGRPRVSGGENATASDLLGSAGGA